MTGPAAAVVALCVAAAVLLLVRGSAPRFPGPPRRRPRWSAADAGRRRGSRPEPPGVRVALAAAEVAALLRAGAPAAAAWAPQHGRAADGEPADALALVLADAALAAARGEDPARVLRRADRPADAAAALDALALAWRTSEVTGAPAAGVLDRLVASLAADAAAQDARDAALAGPRATARVLLVLPLLGLLLGTALGADPVQVLLGTPAGRACAAAGAVCAVVGWGWTSLLVRAAERAG